MATVAQRRAPMSDDARLFACSARRMRLVRAMSLRDVQALTGITISHLSDFERGKADLSLSHALRLARALEIPLLWTAQHHD
jgi:transcriptional regulator with XRE-family HTH domain